MNKRVFLLYFLLAVVVSTIDTSVSCPQRVPDQIRLAFAGNDGVNVGWHLTACPLTTTNPNPNPIVIFGFSPTALQFTSINGKSSFYDNQTCSETSWFYSVELSNLEPSTVYYYQIAGSNLVAASSILNFTSAPTLGSQSQPIKIGCYGDLGLNGLAGTILDGPDLFDQALNALQQKLPEIDFFLHHGDICYADEGPILIPPKTYEQAMDYCQSRMSVLTSVRCYMTAPGNHEINCTEVPKLYDECPADQRNQIPYSHRFNMPSNQSGGYLNSWYSFNYGFVHVTSLSCESDFPNAPSGNLLDTTTQINWLKNDLAAVNRTITPWLIVQCHRPWKGSTALETQFGAGIVDCPACQAAFENIIIQYNVDIYIAGHVHWYERICLNGMYHQCLGSLAVAY